MNITESEKFLLAHTNIHDLHIGTPTNTPTNKTLSSSEAKQDISIFARLLIKAYVGWPVLTNNVKQNILEYLIHLYNTIDTVTSEQLCALLKPLIENIPDNHLAIRFNKTVFKTKNTRTYINVGDNIAGKEPILTKRYQQDIAVIAFSKMLGTDHVRQTINEFITTILPNSKCLIIDLRDNGGGTDICSNILVKFLCGGTLIDSAKNIFIRPTPEAKKIYEKLYSFKPWKNFNISDDLILEHIGDNYTIDTNKAYNKPIYILINGKTGSAAEMFLLRMVHHPLVTVIGANSSGREVFGNVAHCYLPNSNIILAFGMNYRILEYENFELNGYKPNIICKDEEDAMTKALNIELHKSTKY